MSSRQQVNKREDYAFKVNGMKTLVQADSKYEAFGKLMELLRNSDVKYIGKKKFVDDNEW